MLLLLPGLRLSFSSHKHLFAGTEAVGGLIMSVVSSQIHLFAGVMAVGGLILHINTFLPGARGFKSKLSNGWLQ